MAQLYKDFRPTQFDDAGINLDDRQNWLVLGVMQTRDSEALDRSNFRMALEILGGESETCEVHRFGHWGPGWFEIIILHPDRESEANEIEGALAYYPVLSDDDFSSLESEETCEAWEHGAQREWARKLGSVYELSDSTIEFLESADSCDTLAFHEEWHGESNQPWSTRYLEGSRAPDRSDVATLIRKLRSQAA